MRGSTDIELMRLLHGELPAGEARELRARIDRDPALAAAYARLERAWTGLDLPPAAPAPAGFGQRILARARRDGAGWALSWSAAPVWVRAVAAAALAVGVAVGAGVGSLTAASPAEETAPAMVFAEEQDADTGLEPNFAEVYWDAVEELDEGAL